MIYQEATEPFREALGAAERRARKIFLSGQRDAAAVRDEYLRGFAEGRVKGEAQGQAVKNITRPPRGGSCSP
jgi:hypothetical protein